MAIIEMAITVGKRYRYTGPDRDDGLLKGATGKVTALVGSSAWFETGGYEYLVRKSHLEPI